MKNKSHQVKSRMYYYFWGVCTVAVVAGQLYVGAGYREMAEATKGADIRVTCEVAQLNKTGEFE